MITKLFNKFSVKDKVAKKELIRAHVMIALLSLALISQLLINGATNYPDSTTVGVIAGIASMLLLFVALISLSTVVYLYKGKK